MVKTLPEFQKVLLDLCHASVATVGQRDSTVACGKLIQDLMTDRPEQFVKGLARTPGTNEYRLNNDGLKLRYHVEFYRDADHTRIYVGKFAISGDQTDAYPAFSRAATTILRAANAATPDDNPISTE